MFKFDFALDEGASSSEDEEVCVNTRRGSSGTSLSSLTAVTSANGGPQPIIKELKNEDAKADVKVVKLESKLRAISSSTTTLSKPLSEYKASSSDVKEVSSQVTPLVPSSKQDALKRSMPAEQRKVLNTLGDEVVQEIVAVEHLPGRTQVSSASSEAIKSINEHSDVIAGVYEGGLKKWECSEDLVSYLKICFAVAAEANKNNCSQTATSGDESQASELASRVTKPLDFSWLDGSRVLDVGCGHGIPGAFCARQNAAVVVFQDLNEDVLASVTVANAIAAVGGRAIHRKVMHFSDSFGSVLTEDVKHLSLLQKKLKEAASKLVRLERTIDALNRRYSATSDVAHFEVMKARLRDLLRKRVDKLVFTLSSSNSSNSCESTNEACPQNDKGIEVDKEEEEIDGLLEFLEDLIAEYEGQIEQDENADNLSEEQLKRSIERKTRFALASTNEEVIREFIDSDEDEDEDEVENDDEKESVIPQEVEGEQSAKACTSITDKEVVEQKNSTEIDEEKVQDEEVRMVQVGFQSIGHCQFFAGSWSDTKLWDLTLSAHSTPALGAHDKVEIAPQKSSNVSIYKVRHSEIDRAENAKVQASIKALGLDQEFASGSDEESIMYVLVEGALPEESEILVSLETLSLLNLPSQKEQSVVPLIALRVRLNDHRVDRVWSRPEVMFESKGALGIVASAIDSLSPDLTKPVGSVLCVELSSPSSIYKSLLKLGFTEAGWTQNSKHESPEIVILRRRFAASDASDALNVSLETEIISVNESDLLSPERFKLLLSADTLYFVDSYVALLNYIRAVLHKSGVALIAAKRFYFGVGGSTAEFMSLVRKKAKDMVIEVVHTIDDGKSNLREILALRWII